MRTPEAVTFDFYLTLVLNPEGKTRGQAYCDYLAERNLPHAPWEHQMLYDIFPYYGEAYRPDMPEDRKNRFWREFTRRLFFRTEVRVTEEAAVREHVPAIRNIFSSNFFRLYDDVHTVLNRLREGGIKLAVVSNWPGGLNYFCEELGISHYFQAILGSGDFGRAKPDPRIFHEVAMRLQCHSGTVFHVGDTLEEDVKGAERAGFRGILLDRTGSCTAEDVHVIHDLYQLEKMISLET